MTRAYLATGDAVARIDRNSEDWSVALSMQGRPTQCTTADPARPGVLYCGTFGQGLWRSWDGAKTWERIGGAALPPEITAVAIATDATIWAGAEPSAVYRSDDGGESWNESVALRELPSAPTWSFPPRPWTSHVRWIAPDPVEANRLWVGIELGGVMRSEDGGKTWHDRVPTSQYDAHTLRTHRAAPGCLYEAAGGGYAESRDGGVTWQRRDEGLTRRYVWGLAVDPGNPDVMVVSAAPGPREAHGERTGEAAIYRSEGNGWQEIGRGLPAPKGTRAYVLATNEAEPGVFYAVTREGDLYRSGDAGLSWERQRVPWPGGYRAADVRGMVVLGR